MNSILMKGVIRNGRVDVGEPVNVPDEERAAADAWEKKVNDYTIANLDKGVADAFQENVTCSIPVSLEASRRK